VAIDPGSGRPMPQFGGYWRLHLATLPPSAGAFHREEHPAAATLANDAGLDPLDYEGRVALGAACFDATDFPAGCGWLDSQSKVEDALAISALDITTTAPIVFYDKVPVKRQ
jgi:hypothetical protein